MRSEVLTVGADGNLSLLGCYAMLTGFLGLLDADDGGSTIFQSVEHLFLS